MEGFECFVPHENFSELTELTPAEVFRVDAEGVRRRQRAAGVARRAGRSTTAPRARSACSRSSSRAATRATAASSASSPTFASSAGAATRSGDGMNLFVIGAIEATGRVCWSVDEAIDVLHLLGAGSDE